MMSRRDAGEEFIASVLGILIGAEGFGREVRPSKQVPSRPAILRGEDRSRPAPSEVGEVAASQPKQSRLGWRLRPCASDSEHEDGERGVDHHRHKKAQ